MAPRQKKYENLVKDFRTFPADLKSSEQEAKYKAFKEHMKMNIN